MIVVAKVGHPDSAIRNGPSQVLLETDVFIGQEVHHSKLPSGVLAQIYGDSQLLIGNPEIKVWISLQTDGGHETGVISVSPTEETTGSLSEADLHRIITPRTEDLPRIPLWVLVTGGMGIFLVFSLICSKCGDIAKLAVEIGHMLLCSYIRCH